MAQEPDRRDSTTRTVMMVAVGALGGLLLAGYVAWRNLPSLEWRHMSFSLSAAPLPPAEVTGRTQARLYADALARRIEIAADPMAVRATDPAVKAACVRWKLGVLETAQAAALRPSAQLAVVDLWVLSVQLAAFVESREGRAAFGAEQAAARAATASLVQDAEAFAARVLDARSLAAYRPLVTEWADRHPVRTPDMQRPSIALDWLNAAHPLDGVPRTFGSLSDVAAETFAHASTRLVRLPRTLQWRSEASLIENQARLDEVRSVMEQTVQDVNRDGVQGLSVSRLGVTAGRIAAAFGIPTGQHVGALMVDTLKVIGVLLLAVTAVGFGLGWAGAHWMVRRRTERAVD
jgi:hypothetical protein